MELNFFKRSPKLSDAAVKSSTGKVTYAFATPPLRRMSARRKDGSSVELLMRDWGDMRVAYDANGNAYEAYQTEWWIEGKNCFVIVDRYFALDTKSSKEIRDLRLREDAALLESMGIDATSLGCLH
jgi:hypothetical protein